MNVYDFDGTIYNGDTSIDFYLFCIKKKPVLLFKCLPLQISGTLSYFCKCISKEKYKERFFSFLKYSYADNALLEQFWDKKAAKIKKWYLKQKNESDVIVSASPEFLLKPICHRLNVSLIATKVDAKTGKIAGKNCHGKEKVRRFKSEYHDTEIDEFYTDSKADIPLAKIAKKAFWVKNNKIIRFPIKLLKGILEGCNYDMTDKDEKRNT
ncbi:HAD-IB family phosphatase [Ruminococcus sp.]|uniref:HAD-IB family phosphatase n=1 Tax=Ruminococcus sp. TaxID=41978 RepID=UPI001B450943|nr:HAD-IB family phosphatase [Ruminococcus sp.]MBP5432151.1 HAD-IB family phosphatase [Ruminococcus sp.]